MPDTERRRGRGRPPGARTGASRLTAAPAITPPTPTDASDNQKVKAAYKHADLDTLCSRQLSLIDETQQRLWWRMRAGFQSDGKSVSSQDVKDLMDLSNALVRAADALRKSTALASELADKLTPEQLLEAAIKKVEAQDLGTIKYAIRRLTEYRRALVPHAKPQMQLEDDGPVVNAIAALGGAT